jgi:hypothetical protein
MPEQVVPVGMGREPGDHRNAEPVQVIRELVQLGTIDAGIDQDQPILPAQHDGIGPDPLTLPDPDAVGHLSQHRFTLSGIYPRRERSADGEASSNASRSRRIRMAERPLVPRVAFSSSGLNPSPAPSLSCQWARSAPRVCCWTDSGPVMPCGVVARYEPGQPGNTRSTAVEGSPIRPGRPPAMEDFPDRLCGWSISQEH